MKLCDSLFGEFNFVPRWYALYARRHHEKKVEMRLKEKGIDCYLPLTTVYRRWSDRYKKIEEPLFSCYIFVFIALQNRLHVLQTNGALKLISFNGSPAPIPENQITNLKLLLDNKINVNKTDFFTPGKKVKVVRGVLQGLEGTLVALKNNYRFVITIDGIKQAIWFEIDACNLDAC